MILLPFIVHRLSRALEKHNLKLNCYRNIKKNNTFEITGVNIFQTIEQTNKISLSRK